MTWSCMCIFFQPKKKEKGGKHVVGYEDISTSRSKLSYYGFVLQQQSLVRKAVYKQITQQYYPTKKGNK